MQTPSTPPSCQISILIASPTEKIRTTLAAILETAGWIAYQATNHAEGIALLEKHDVPVVIAERGWREILEFTAGLHTSPCVIVTERFADESLWAEVLNLGGYDVLPQPFEVNEVIRIAGAGLRRSKFPNVHRLPVRAVTATPI